MQLFNYTICSMISSLFDSVRLKLKSEDKQINLAIRKQCKLGFDKIRKNKAFLRVAFVDDLGGAGELLELRRWWDNIVLQGPKLGYNSNPSKSWLGLLVGK